MIPPLVRRTLSAVALAAAAAVPLSAAAEEPAARLLDVPFLAQSEDLCGGAAAAMVMRYWGATGTYPESFEGLVDRSAAGIRTEALLESLRTLGWQAIAAAGDGAMIRRHLASGRPPIVLVEDRPGRFHYVVVVGWTGGRVVLHDPARAPFRIVDEAAFMRAWARSSHWLLLALPGSGQPAAAGADDTRDAPATRAGNRAAPAGVCGVLTEEGVRLARSGALDEAQRVLELAVEQCPGAAAPRRELAGVHALRRDWTRAAEESRQALARDPSDEHAARILSTSLYLSGDAAAALDAWNQLGEPTIDLVDIRGLERTRFSVAAEALQLRPRAQLTSALLARGARRLDRLPAVAGSRVTYEPVEHGLVRVTASVLERPLLPTAPLALIVKALDGLIDREVAVDVASPTGNGELLQAAWRWWEERPRVSVGARVPVRFGVVSLQGSGEQETYGNVGREIVERRRRAAAGLSDWATDRLLWEGTVALERWDSWTGLAVEGALHYHVLGDRLQLRADTSLRGRAGSWSAGSAIEWQSRRDRDGPVWLAHGGASMAGAAAPLAAWPGAGTGQGRAPLLRAHPLLSDGVIRDAVFGRRLLHGGAEWRYWKWSVAKVVRVSPAAFVDVGRAYDVPEFGDARAHADAGIGVRMALPGAGVLRADLARGLRDGRLAVSFGWTR